MGFSGGTFAISGLGGGGASASSTVTDQVDFTTVEPNLAAASGLTYIHSGPTGTGSTTTGQTFTDTYLYMSDGVTWTETVPAPGQTVFDEAQGINIIYNGSTWEASGADPRFIEIDNFVDFTTNEPVHAIGEKYVHNELTGAGSITTGDTFVRWRIYESDGAAWEETSPVQGYRLYNKTSDAAWYFDGLVWIPEQPLPVAGTQNANFTAVNGFVFPVDVSAEATTSQLDITPPDNPYVGMTFEYYDATASCTTTRVVRCTFTGELMMGLGPSDYAEINSAAGSLICTYVGGVTGWRISILN